jgi:hypothetical protein
MKILVYLTETHSTARAKMYFQAAKLEVPEI